jgi:ribosomal protein L7Ae-like RNA K-turn-binding protein
MNDKFLQFLGLIKRSGKVVEGYNKCEEIIKKSKVYLIIISLEASENTKDKFRGFSSRLNIPYIEKYISEALGSSIGRPEINVLCVIDEHMAKKLIELNETPKNNRG